MNVRTIPSIIRKQWLPAEVARHEITAYADRFGEGHLGLACHAALPLMLTPELLNLIRINFVERAPWMAEADFLLSPFCRPIEENLFEVEPGAREVLLSVLEESFGERQARDLATFLLTYLEKRPGRNRRSDIARTQQWIARAYIEPDKVIEEMKTLLEHPAAGEEELALSLPDQIQIATVVEVTAEPLQRAAVDQDYRYLTDYSRILAHALYGDEEDIENLHPILDPQEQRLLSGMVKGLQGAPQTSQDQIVLSEFEFDVISVNERGKEIERRRGTARQFTEDLAFDRSGMGGITLAMVEIPGGAFLMGSPENEKNRSDTEVPQHEVTVAPFWMGCYPVTQEQWRAVAALPQITRELDPDPSGFKGAKRPVETVSWHDAVEFCARLSQKTGRAYRLPSEAEWEYACRAGTTTPFHFGVTITADLANYNGNDTYASEPKGTYREETTEVGSFPPNAFGLCDMHGNVWEWCADPWHENYEGAPSDGSVWEEEGKSNKRLLRGGSWNDGPWLVRCALRYRVVPVLRYDDFGFRVVVVSSRTF